MIEFPITQAGITERLWSLPNFYPYTLIETARSETMLVCNGNDGPAFEGAILTE